MSEFKNEWIDLRDAFADMGDAIITAIPAARAVGRRFPTSDYTAVHNEMMARRRTERAMRNRRRSAPAVR